MNILNISHFDLKKALFSVLLTLCFIFSVSAQEEIIPLWEGIIPGSKNDAQYIEKQTMEKEQLVGLSQVTLPTMTVFKPKKPNGTAVIICPGGGYGFLAVDKEGFKLAQWFSDQGVTGFVLKYRLPNDAIMEQKNIGPLQDAQRAIRLVRQNAKNFDIDPEKVGIMGFSAGGHLAASASTKYMDKVYETDFTISARPDFSILIYPVISMQAETTHRGSQENLLGKSPSDSLIQAFSNEMQVMDKTPMAFLVHAADDDVVPVENSMNYFLALKKLEVPAEMHIYEHGGHGFGMGVEGTAKTWPESLTQWMQMHDLIVN